MDRGGRDPGIQGPWSNWINWINRSAHGLRNVLVPVFFVWIHVDARVRSMHRPSSFPDVPAGSSSLPAQQLCVGQSGRRVPNIVRCILAVHGVLCVERCRACLFQNRSRLCGDICTTKPGVGNMSTAQTCSSRPLATGTTVGMWKRCRVCQDCRWPPTASGRARMAPRQVGAC